ncbi:MAG: acetyl-CoA carboxylase biotin carboxylase subunit [candidate division Zixibacteria bacterium]|nr:acetyl-CoA carboxylase biotin carboxylase subunit [candidate division Zixibacteria bacterium]
MPRAKHPPIRRILIANRGEIAVRIIRACRCLGIESVAVFSEPDRAALHVRMADFAYPIGPAEAKESYLNRARLIGTARRSGVDAIHPGYGFLSENPAFAQSVIHAGLAWIGPPPDAMALMGDKVAARALMRQQGVPIVPGSEGAITDSPVVRTEATRAGFPILLKAVAGGGGKGMRLVRSASEWDAAFESASREALRAFGDGRVYWEKYIDSPHHVEIQILADAEGRAVSLGERECSIQRRHQKLIEESPSPMVDPALRAQMSQAAIAAAEGCGYVGAGTVEFLVDSQRRFYFLEMNTRLQVEHPVTETVTGVDLVAEQIRIAAGESRALPAVPDCPWGHSIEFRIYAEDPDNDFFPSPGVLQVYREPHGPGIRVDSGVYEGAEVPIHYDPLMAKLVVWGADRHEAIARAVAALEEYAVVGPVTTIGFHRRVVRSPEFIKGNTTTDFVERNALQLPQRVDIGDHRREATALAATLYVRSRCGGKAGVTIPDGRGEPRVPSLWAVEGRRQNVHRWQPSTPIARRNAAIEAR